jgi:hypothetical protein
MKMSDTMMPGKYWIGDPCYVFPHDGPMGNKWDELLAEVEFFETAYGELDEGRIKVWASPTAYGDGSYTSNCGEVFSVDSGLLGIVPQETVDYLGRTDNDLADSGLFIEFKEPFWVGCLSRGYFSFGHIHIDTCGGYDMDGDDCDSS